MTTTRDMEGLGYEVDSLSEDLLKVDAETTLVEVLEQLLETATDFEARVESFSEAGLLTYDAGLVLALPNGFEFQLTVKRSK